MSLPRTALSPTSRSFSSTSRSSVPSASRSSGSHESPPTLKKIFFFGDSVDFGESRVSKYIFSNNGNYHLCFRASTPDFSGYRVSSMFGEVREEGGTRELEVIRTSGAGRRGELLLEFVAGYDAKVAFVDDSIIFGSKTIELTFNGKVDSPDFGEKLCWDLALATQNSNGKLLHSSKAMLGYQSPYFMALFFGVTWVEKDKEQLNLDVDYDVVLEVLRILTVNDRHLIKFDAHTPSEIFKLYRFADKFDFPFIRKLVEKELNTQPTVAALEVAVKLELPGAKTEILKLMNHKTVQEYMNLHWDDSHFTNGEMSMIMDKIYDENKPKKGRHW